jgi:hypothetical protein
MEDNLARPRSTTPSSIRSLLQQSNDPALRVDVPGADAVLPNNSDLLPRAGESYQAHALHGNKPEMMIHFVLRDFSYEGFSYADCERIRLVPGEKPGSGPVLIMRFNGSVVTEVLIEGRHLQTVYHLIGLHQVPWLWEHPSPADFTDDKATLIKRITFREVER